jgi:signal transduction histidine kinase
MDYKPEPLDVAAFCRHIVDEVLSATEHRCPILLSLGAMPSATAADQRLLRHAFTNLLGNAVKYSERGATVHFSVLKSGNELIWEIMDHGIGIPEKDMEWLFTAFQRGSNVADRPGTGLGLVLVKRCLDLHGATVNISSKIGSGTTVTVRLLS